MAYNDEEHSNLPGRIPGFRRYPYVLAGNLKPLNIGVRVRIDDPWFIFLDDVIILPCTNMLQPYKVVSDCQIDTLYPYTEKARSPGNEVVSGHCQSLVDGVRFIPNY